MSWKQIIALASLIATVIAINSGIMLPVIKSEIAPLIDARIEQHRTEPLHSGAVPRGEFELILNRLDKIDRSIERFHQP